MVKKWATGMLVASLAVLAFATCAEGDIQGGPVTSQPDAGTTTVCKPGTKRDCECQLGCGTQICLEDGSGYDDCECGSGDICGDCICDNESGENCHTCLEDCGNCAPCNIAPACESAMIPAPDPPHVAELDVPKMELLSRKQIRARLADQVSRATDAMRVLAAVLDRGQAGEDPVVTAVRGAFAAHPAAATIVHRELVAAGMGSPAAYRAAHPVARTVPEPVTAKVGEFPGGTIECGAPLLRVGVHSVEVHNASDPIFDEEDEIYCIIQAEAQSGAELRLTPLVEGLGDGDEKVMSLESGVFWGQLEPTTPGGDILVTYDCIESDDPTQYTNLLDAVSKGATNIGQSGAPYGWVFSTVGAVAGVVSAALSTNGDDKLFNAQQYIPLDLQLALTCGASWGVRRGESSTFGSWDWELHVWAWGCAEYGKAEPGKCEEPPPTGGAGGAGGGGAGGASG